MNQVLGCIKTNDNNIAVIMKKSTNIFGIPDDRLDHLSEYAWNMPDGMPYSDIYKEFKKNKNRSERDFLMVILGEMMESENDNCKINLKPNANGEYRVWIEDKTREHIIRVLKENNRNDYEFKGQVLISKSKQTIEVIIINFCPEHYTLLQQS
jgi:hypothetical protein